MVDEADFIARLRAIATHPAARGLDDDAAVLTVGSETLVMTHDTLVEGVHVLPEQDPADIAWKLVAVNLSDLAAKGAEPLGILLSHMLGAGDDRFVEGLHEVLDRYDVPLLGGDTVASPGPRVWGLTAIGRATHAPVPSRAGARVGDAIFVSGTLGAALAGFEAVRDGSDGDSAAYRRPVPLLADGQALAPLVTAMMDISDGLLLDARRMAEASGRTFAIDTRSVPIALPEDRREEALRWGDDYQLLFTAPESAELPVPAHRIGTVRSAGGHPLLLDGEPPEPGDTLGYEHRAPR